MPRNREELLPALTEEQIEAATVILDERYPCWYCQDIACMAPTLAKAGDFDTFLAMRLCSAWVTQKRYSVEK